MPASALPRSVLMATLLLLLQACGGSGGGAAETPTTPPSATLSDPVTTPLTGTHATYDVGPGQPYEEPDTVPWGALEAGDVVNIHHRTTPYLWKLGLRGQGTAQAPIVINGVTDASGNRPCFDFKDARTASGSNPGGNSNVFTATPAYGESLGGIVIKRGVVDSYYTYSPRWIQIQHLELMGAANGNSYRTLAGDTVAYAGAAGLYVHLGEDILLENLVIRDNGNGIFTMAKDGLFSQACKRITVRNCRVYGNGVAGSYLQHNFYVQCHLPVIEGNYIGQVRAGSQGASYKSRSSGEIFRYNHVIASARAVDWVYSEEQDTDGISTQPEYGTDYAYGNVFVNDANLSGGFASAPIHYGGDNLGEQDPGAPVLILPVYRRQLYFWNNTAVFRATQAQAWRMCVFDLSLVNTTVDAWNNVIVCEGGATPTELSWVQNAGTLRLRGANLAYGSILPATYGADPSMYSVEVPGTLLNADPLLRDLAHQDYRLGLGSPAIDQATGTPSGVPATLGSSHPLLGEPRLGTNGWIPRHVQGGAFDLGALEAEP